MILQGTSYVAGTIPFKYLGVPLHSSRLTKDMFSVLIEKIRGKIKHWSTNLLSYVGKVQLLNSVIFGLESFWCASFLLPKGIIDDIDKLCRGFLWGYSAGGRRMVFLGWKKVCRTTAEGGFGIREVLDWNKALLLRMLWRIHHDTTSVWCSWCRHYVLQQFTVWTVTGMASMSSTWKAMLLVRDVFFGLVGGVN
ncbi:hypothetical protein RND81_04G196200 [Saponaria officinalis]|uniref:Reverse transcriptase n=1 Tax=Saponaria officinalis TaxID=3572 RepID=A0AAW1LFC1_SAPOF